MVRSKHHRPLSGATSAYPAKPSASIPRPEHYAWRIKRLSLSKQAGIR